MARLPLVAIIGRPNAGKSTLFNRLTGTRQAIVTETPGTTRDHVARRVDADDISYLLIDTGGIGGGSEDHDLEKDVSAQSLIALEAADLILFTVDSRTEIAASDHEIVKLLRRKRRRHVPVLIVVTKCDRPGEVEESWAQFHALGIADAILPVSGLQGYGMGELEEAIAEQLRALHFGAAREDTSAEDGTEGEQPRIAIVGKPNVGKSSIVNALMSDPQRASSPRLVSDIPGTTRDPSDTIVRHEGKEYVFVDTAGLKRHAKLEGDIESLSHLKSIRALQDADIAILVLDATEPVSKQDKRIAAIAVDEGKGLILLVNKVDALTSAQKKEKASEVAQSLLFCRFAPLLFTSAITREGLPKIFPLIESVDRNRKRRIPVRELRRWFDATVEGVPARALSQSKHVTQAADVPPTFVLFVPNPKAVQLGQLRHLENSLRSTFGFEGTPIRWITKPSRSREARES